MIEFKKIILTRNSRTQTKEALNRVYALLQTLQCEVYPDESCRDALDAPGMSFPRLEALAHCDLALVIGGDGALLKAARTLAPHGVPVVGINLGRLGFLVDIMPAQLQESLHNILHGRYIRERRFLLEAAISRSGETINHGLALNDVIISSHTQTRMTEFFTYIDDHYVNNERGNGIVIATPTGSTAYALSSGGPVLHPLLSAIALVPICPHTLSHRPVVVDSRSIITIVIDRECSTPVQLSCDGQSNIELQPGDQIRIQRSQIEATLLHPESYDFFDILRVKLNWGKNPKQEER